VWFLESLCAVHFLRASDPCCWIQKYRDILQMDGFPRTGSYQSKMETPGSPSGTMVQLSQTRDEPGNNGQRAISAREGDSRLQLPFAGNLRNPGLSDSIFQAARELPAIKNDNPPRPANTSFQVQAPPPATMAVSNIMSPHDEEPAMKLSRRYSYPAVTERSGPQAFQLQGNALLHGRADGAALFSSKQVPKHFCPVPTCKRHRQGFVRVWNMRKHVREIHGPGVVESLTPNRPAVQPFSTLEIGELNGRNGHMPPRLHGHDDLTQEVRPNKAAMQEQLERLEYERLKLDSQILQLKHNLYGENS